MMRAAGPSGRSAAADRTRGAARGVVAVALAVLAATAVPAQERARHGRLFPPQDRGLLEGPDRDAWQQPGRIMDALGIADGAAVADVGAGGGWFTVRLARRVGPNGLVTQGFSEKRIGVAGYGLFVKVDRVFLRSKVGRRIFFLFSPAP